MRDKWTSKKLNEISEIGSGNGAPQDKMLFKDGIFPFFRTSDVGRIKKGVIYKSADYLNGRGIRGLKLFKKGTILFPKSGASTFLNHRVIMDTDGYVSSHLATIKANNSQVLDKFLLYFLTTVDARDLIQEVNYPSLKTSEIGLIEIPIPSLSKQQTIVDFLDNAFDAINQGTRNIQKNLQNAKDLFESYLQNVFANQGEDWTNETLQNLLEKGWIVSHLDGNHGGEYPRKEEFKSKGVPYISANCIKGTEVDFSLSKFLSPDRAMTIRKGIAVNNDVLFAHNATVGPVAILKTNEEKVILGTSLTYYRCNPKYIIPEYLANYMRSKEFKEQYEIGMRQSTRNQVPITKQREFYHIIPPIEIQKGLIIKLESLLQNTQSLELHYRQKLNTLEELKKSILQKAFAGELT